MLQLTIARTAKTETSMSPEEKTFFQKLGERIAALRNKCGLTQVQLADALGYSQQQVLSFEKGVPLSALRELSKALGVPVEELRGAGESRPANRGPTPKLQRQLEQLSQLPRSQQRFVSQMLGTVLQQAER